MARGGPAGGVRIFDARNLHLAVAREQIVGAKSAPRAKYFEFGESIEILHGLLCTRAYCEVFSVLVKISSNLVLVLLNSALICKFSQTWTLA